ncbi:hypothetical protein [Methanospirillum hungatei]|uniref:hypothetical protein n=1 Tax=Methanospirillum hungatei TaxID=2203 RepID=UPI0026F286E8|nr:hypothetical protein [Methanospirillum hungatei]MCA1917202.1 hypothetical protein [Methanospirillum hungatei]
MTTLFMPQHGIFTDRKQIKDAISQSNQKLILLTGLSIRETGEEGKGVGLKLSSRIGNGEESKH